MKQKKHHKALIAILSVLIVIFILIAGYFLIPVSESVEQTVFYFIAVLGLAFSLLGIALVALAIKKKIKGKLKIFLILTGISAICPLVFSILHNLFYALAIITSHITLLKYLMEFLHAASFIIALVVSPVVFLAGAVGSIVLFSKKKK